MLVQRYELYWNCWTLDMLVQRGMCYVLIVKHEICTPWNLDMCDVIWHAIVWLWSWPIMRRAWECLDFVVQVRMRLNEYESICQFGRMPINLGGFPVADVDLSSLFIVKDYDVNLGGCLYQFGRIPTGWIGRDHNMNYMNDMPCIWLTCFDVVQVDRMILV